MLERSYVFVDGERIQWNEETMTFLDIEENISGHDKITFEYNKKTYSSNIISK